MKKRFKFTASLLIFASCFVGELSFSYFGARLESTALNKIAQPQIFLLTDLLNTNQTEYFGITNYEAIRRQKLDDIAKNYIRLRNSSARDSRKRYLENCKNEKDPFCDYEKNRLQTRMVSKNVLKSISRKKFRKWMLNADLEHLQSLSYQELISFLKNVSAPQNLDFLVESIKGMEACVNPSLLNSIAAKLEEFFPQEKFVSDAKALYSKSISCGTDAPSAKAAYRLAILDIWQNQCISAEPLLSQAEHSLPELQSRAKYWRGFCAEQSLTKRKGLAPILQMTPPTESLINFQNILAHGDKVHSYISTDLTHEIKVMNRSMIAPESNKLVEAIEEMIVLGEYVRAAEMVEALLPKIVSAEGEFKLYLALLMRKTKNSITEFHILSQLFIDAPQMIHENTLKMYFPLEYYEAAKSSGSGIDPLIVLSIVRQESAFNPNAKSRVGARGLMQVMLPTARKIASVASKKLFDPSTNLKVGIKLFMNQVQRFNGDFELALAAYNAGRLKVEDWQRRYPAADKMLFLELIPYRETRDYVTMILRNYYWYQRLYNLKSDTKSAYKMPSLIERINEKSKFANMVPPAGS